MDLGQRITELRKQKGYNRDVLGDMVGTSGAVMGRYERGEITPSVEIAKKIADALEVSLDYLAGSTDQLPDKKLLKKVNELQRLDPEEQKYILKTLDALIRDAKTRRAYSD